MKVLFEYITGSYTLFNNLLHNYVAMFIIGCISYSIAYRAVGKLYRCDVIDGYGAGHILHWFIRLIVFSVIFILATTVLRIWNWFHGLPVYKWWIIGSVVGISIIIECIMNFKNKKQMFL